jgi:hypothetical protein
MNSRIKQYMLIAVLAAAGYFIMNNHIIFYGSDVHLLKKSSLHLHYTFYSIKQKKPEVIMKIDYLRWESLMQRKNPVWKANITKFRII